MKNFLIFLIFLSLFVVFFFYKTYSSSIHYSLDAHSEDRISLSIPKGANGSEISQILFDKGVINSTQVFNFYLKQKHLSSQLKAGRFVLQKNYEMPQIIDVLVSGQSTELAFTILEGWTIKQIANQLEKEGISHSDSFMNCIENCHFDSEILPSNYLEGYLYPDTYFIDPSSYSDEKFIRRLISTLEAKISKEDLETIASSGRNIEDIIKMASIVEKEEKNKEARPVVAGILWNRIDSNTGLYADATLLYGLGRNGGGLTYDDLQSDNPYNTRKYAGLPPTPISNPSIDSIRASIYAQKTDYWYYLHDSEGRIHYAKTLRGHNLNKKKYL